MPVKIAVWKTGHEIADTVADDCSYGLDRYHKWPENAIYDVNKTKYWGIFSRFDLHVGYGILRGISDVFKVADTLKKPWIHLDKGYFKPRHFNGYYRISLRGTQQTIGLDKLEPDYKRLDALGIEFPTPGFIRSDSHILIVPPTDAVAQFFGLNANEWIANIVINSPGENYRIRHKDSALPLDYDLHNCRKVITFNSSIGWEALRRGIAVESDPNHSIVGAYQKLVDKPLHIDFPKRRELFAIMSGLQLTLQEIKAGKLWPLLNHLLSISGGIPEKQLSPMSQPIAS